MKEEKHTEGLLVRPTYKKREKGREGKERRYHREEDNYATAREITI